MRKSPKNRRARRSYSREQRSYYARFSAARFYNAPCNFDEFFSANEKRSLFPQSDLTGAESTTLNFDEESIAAENVDLSKENFIPCSAVVPRRYEINLKDAFSEQELFFPGESDNRCIKPEMLQLLDYLWQERELITTTQNWNFDGSGVYANERRERRTGSKTFQDLAREMNPGGGEFGTDYQSVVITSKDRRRRISLLWGQEKRVDFWTREEQNGEFRYAFGVSLADWTLKQVNRFFGGIWFERYAVACINRMMEENGCVDYEILSNVHDSAGGEIDVVLVVGGIQCYLLEMKTGFDLNEDEVRKFERKVEAFREINADSPATVSGFMICLQDGFRDAAFLDSVRASQSVACLYGAKIPQFLQDDFFLNMTPGSIWNRV